MTTLEHIVRAIEIFGFPFSPGVYTGSEDHWFTYNYVDDHGELFGDDEPLETINRIQLHYFLPVEENYLKMKNEIRDALLTRRIYISGDREYGRSKPGHQTSCI